MKKLYPGYYRVTAKTCDGRFDTALVKYIDEDHALLFKRTGSYGWDPKAYPKGNPLTGRHIAEWLDKNTKHWPSQVSKTVKRLSKKELFLELL